jgi:lysophospholipase L1-like esterase
MGDSITVGIGTGATGGGYRIELFKKATADGKKITFDGAAMSSCNMSTPQNPPSGFVNTHSACSGWTIQQIAGMVTGSLQKKPDIILLMAGTNDVRGDANGAPMRLGTLLDQIFTADSHVLVVVAKLTPLSGANLTQLNTGIQNAVEMRAAAGKHVMLVDMNTGYPANSMPDGVHPNQAGYAWMADVWYKAIQDLLP